MDKVEEYMKHQKLPGNLKYLIRDYYLNKFKDGKKLFNEEEMLADLSPQLKTEARTRLACYPWACVRLSFLD